MNIVHFFIDRFNGSNLPPPSPWNQTYKIVETTVTIEPTDLDTLVFRHVVEVL